MACEDFDFDLGRAVLEQLRAQLADIEGGPLTALGQVEDRRGIYQLIYQDVPVYIGKANESILTRLTKHQRKIVGRRNIDITDMAFKGLYVHGNWAASVSEDMLIKDYVRHGQASWNGTGFGINDPGRNRDNTVLAANHFDRQYPIRDDWPCSDIGPNNWPAWDLIQTFKDQLPFLFRTGVKEADVAGVQIVVPQRAMSARDLLILLAQHVPGSKATIFPGHMILYVNDHHLYDHGEVVWPL